MMLKFPTQTETMHTKHSLNRFFVRKKNKKRMASVSGILLRGRVSEN